MEFLYALAPFGCAAMMVYCMLMMRRHGSSSAKAEEDADGAVSSEESVGRQN